MDFSQPLSNRTPIINPDGTPTEYFIRWARQFDKNVSGGMDGLVPEGRQISAGFGLTGGGDLTTDRTISLDANFSDLNDVDMVTVPPQDGEVPTWDEGAGLWVPGVGGGGGGTPLGYWSKTDTGTGSSQNVTLPHSVSAENEILVFVNGIEYPTTGYSVSGTTLTLTTNASGDAIEVRGLTGGSGGGGGGSDWIDVDLSGGLVGPVTKWGRTNMVYSLPGAPTFDFSSPGVLQIELAAYKPISSYVGFYLSPDGTIQTSLLKQADGNTVMYYGTSGSTEGSPGFAWDFFNASQFVTLRATIMGEPSLTGNNIWQAQAGIKPSPATGFNLNSTYPLRTTTMQLWIVSTSTTLSYIRGLRYRIGNYPV